MLGPNEDKSVIRDFGTEWKIFDNKDLSTQALHKNFLDYFSIFPWQTASENWIGFDMGCGTGRWAQFVAPKVKLLNCIDPSDAIYVAKDNLIKNTNIKYYKETTENCSIESGSQDFGYCLGVLHHIPNSQKALEDCAKLLKKGAPFLLYLYYNFENRPLWFKVLWRISDLIRKLLSRQPTIVKLFLCNLIASFIYYPCEAWNRPQTECR